MTTATGTSDGQGRKAIWPGNIPPPAMPYSPAVSAGGWVFVAGQIASNYIEGVAPEARDPEGSPYLHDPLELQSRYVLGNLARTLEAAGADIRTDLARIYQWFTSPYPTPAEFEQGNTWPRISITPYLRTLYGEFATRHRPASTGMGVRQLLSNGTKVEVDMIAVPARDGMLREDVPAPDGVPAPLAGYSPGVRIGDWVFLAGEIPVDWMGDYGRAENYGEPSGLALDARVNPYFWYNSPIEAQTEYTLQKLDRIAKAAGTTLDRCVKATVYIGHPNDFAGMDRVWRQWFPSNPPARVVIPFMGLGGKGSRVEIAMKLLHGSSSLAIERIRADDAHEPFGHEPQAVKVGHFLFFSTQFPGLGKPLQPPLVRSPHFPWYGLVARAQVEDVMSNVEKICSKAGTSLQNIVRRQCFHEDFVDFAEAMDAWAAHFPDQSARPASTTIEVGGPLLVPGAKVLYDLIAYVP